MYNNTFHWEVDMGRINWSRVVLGGLAAGVVMNLSEFIMTVPVLGRQMAAELTTRNLPPMGGRVTTFYIVMAFVVGILTVWLYAAIRPRFGRGPKTAIYAGLAVWFLAFFRSRLGLVAIGVFSIRLMTLAAIWGLAEMILASLAGAWLYREQG
jgi:hypothetical protein